MQRQSRISTWSMRLCRCAARPGSGRYWVVRLCCAIIATVFCLSACDTRSDTESRSGALARTPTPVIFFPQLVRSRDLTEAPEGLTALLVGTLVETNGCLRIDTGEGPGTLVLWPRNYSISTEGAAIRILDDEGNVVARVGDEVRFGGGTVSEAEDPQGYADLRRRTPASCDGPYWFLHGVARVVGSPTTGLP